MTIKQAFSQALKAARKERNLRQDMAAELLKLSIREYGNLERGNSSPSAETLIRIYREFGIDLYKLDFDLPNKE